MSKVFQIGISESYNKHIEPLIESENIDYYNNKFKKNFNYLDFRRNIVTKSIQLNDLIGKTLIIGEITLRVNDLCRPCKDLQNKLGENNIIKEFLRKGGVRCEILTSGRIQVGDKILIS